MRTIESRPLMQEFSEFRDLRFCLDQEKSRWIYYLHPEDLNAVWQYDPISNEKRKLVFSGDFNPKQYFSDIVWANDTYLLLKVDEKNTLNLHFMEIKDESLISLGSINVEEITIEMLSVLPKHRMILFRNKDSDYITLWTIQSNESWIARAKIAPESEEDEMVLSQKAEEEIQIIDIDHLPTLSLTMLEFIHEKAIIVVSDDAGVIIRWNITEGGLEKAWGCRANAEKNRISLHFDQIIFLQERRGGPSEVISLSIDKGEKLWEKCPIGMHDHYVPMLFNINDDRILLWEDSDFTQAVNIFNIRTKRSEYYTDLLPKISGITLAEKYTKLSPIAFITWHNDSTKSVLWTIGKNGPTCTTLYHRKDALFGKTQVLPLKGGYFFVLRNEAENVSGLASTISTDPRGNDALLMFDTHYSDPIEEIILARTWAAISFAMLIEKSILSADIARYFLTFIYSGYESPRQLKSIQKFSSNLLTAARKMLANHKSAETIAEKSIKITDHAHQIKMN